MRDPRMELVQWTADKTAHVGQDASKERKFLLAIRELIDWNHSWATPYFRLAWTPGQKQVWSSEVVVKEKGKSDTKLSVYHQRYFKGKVLEARSLLKRLAKVWKGALPETRGTYQGTPLGYEKFLGQQVYILDYARGLLYSGENADFLIVSKEHPIYLAISDLDME